MPEDFLPAHEEQVPPLVDHLDPSPVSHTIPFEELQKMEKDASRVLSDKVAALRKHIEDAMKDLEGREEDVIRDGRSMFDYVLGIVKRAQK